ncbi:MAG TPA: hypothetical protein VGF49_09405 [Candidatus Solibacter sp.]
MRTRRITGIHTLDGGVAAGIGAAASANGTSFMGDVNSTVVEVGGRSTAVAAGMAGMDGGKRSLSNGRGSRG